MSKQRPRSLKMKRQLRYMSHSQLQQAYRQLWKWAQNEPKYDEQEEHDVTDGTICPRLNAPPSPRSDD